MYSKFQITGKYLQYYFNAANSRGHGTHSPFIFHFITKVLNDRTEYPEYRLVNDLRKKLAADHTMLDIRDLGAGSAMNSSSRRSVSSILASAAKPEKFGRLFFRMAKMYRPATILELGTSLGISAACFSLGNPSAKMITIEGADPIAAIARENLQEIGATGTKVLTGNFDSVLPAVLKETGQVDLAFIDGNHRYNPTTGYFSRLLENAGNDTIMIFDDIHWSREMEDAWAFIREHPAVTTTVDLFFIGIVFLRKEFLVKQEFTIRF